MLGSKENDNCNFCYSVHCRVQVYYIKNKEVSCTDFTTLLETFLWPKSTIYSEKQKIKAVPWTGGLV